MPTTMPSEIFRLLAEECDELGLLQLDDGGIFAPNTPALAQDLRALAAALAQATTRASAELGVPLAPYPALSVLSQPAWADEEPGVVVRMITMVRSEEDPAWDAAARIDLPEAIGRLADELSELESSGLPPHSSDVHQIVDTAQHVCSLLHVVAGQVGSAALRPRER